MKPKLNFNRIKSYLSIGLFLMILSNVACKKEDNKSELDGTWDFKLNCNKILYRPCWGPSHYDYNDMIIFDNGVITNMWDDSVIYSEKYYIDNDYLIIGTNDTKFVKEFDLKGDTLTLIDTCMTCDINTYIRR